MTFFYYLQQLIKIQISNVIDPLFPLLFFQDLHQIQFVPELWAEGHGGVQELTVFVHRGAHGDLARAELLAWNKKKDKLENNFTS